MPTAPANKNVVNWVTKRRTDLTDGGMISRFELWHAVDGEVSERLGLYEMETRDEEEDPEDLVQEIWNDASEDASTRPQGSYQRYVIKAYRGESHEPDEAKAFSLTGSCVSSAMGGTESPTPRGLMAQEMRQNDNLHGMMMRMAEGTAGQLASDLQKSREENANLLLQRSRLLEIEQRLLDRTHEREMDRQERKQAAERMDMVLGMITNFAPMILSKLFENKPMPAALGAAMGMAGAPAGPPRAPAAMPSPEQQQVEAAQAARVRRVLARDAGIGNLLGTLDADQVGKLANLLRPDQAMGFMQVYQDFAEEHRAAEEAKDSSQSH